MIPPGMRVAMTETTPFTIGADVSCSDGACGKVARVVVAQIASFEGLRTSLADEILNGPRASFFPSAP
jgi:hypothetical protein